MAIKTAAIFALLAFAICLMLGGVGAENPFSTAVWRALVAMGGTFLVGLVLGAMAGRMLQEAQTTPAETPENSSTDSTVNDR